MFGAWAVKLVRFFEANFCYLKKLPYICTRFQQAIFVEVYAKNAEFLQIFHRKHEKWRKSLIINISTNLS